MCAKAIVRRRGLERGACGFEPRGYDGTRRGTWFASATPFRVARAMLDHIISLNARAESWRQVSPPRPSL